jgi:hypothetical protein
MENAIRAAFVTAFKMGQEYGSRNFTDEQIEKTWESYRNIQNWPKRQTYPNCAHCGQLRNAHFGRAEYCSNSSFMIGSGQTYEPGNGPRWACLECSDAAGVTDVASMHITHAFGESCPRVQSMLGGKNG